MNVREEIKRIRQELSLNQKDFAKKLDISHVHYQRMESGKYDFTLDIIRKAADLINKTAIIVWLDKQNSECIGCQYGGYIDEDRTIPCHLCNDKF